MGKKKEERIFRCTIFFFFFFILVIPLFEKLCLLIFVKLEYKNNGGLYLTNNEFLVGFSESVYL